MRLKQYAALLAASMAVAADKSNRQIYDEESCTAPIFYCGDCIHCPQGNKTYCKVAKRSTSKQTLVNRCKYFNYGSTRKDLSTR